MIKKLLCVGLAFLMLISLGGCAYVFDTVAGVSVLFIASACDNLDRCDKEEIVSFVLENEDALRNAVSKGDFSNLENGGIIQDISVDTDCIDFFCSGAGFGSQTSYAGFFYTAENDMTAIWCAPSSSRLLTESGNGYEWKESSGDNRYYAEKICENFYYYEASF